MSENAAIAASVVVGGERAIGSPGFTPSPVDGFAFGKSEGFGATCDFDWQVVSSSFRFENVGFRCCFDGATPP